MEVELTKRIIGMNLLTKVGTLCNWQKIIIVDFPCHNCQPLSFIFYEENTTKMYDNGE